MVFNMGAYWVPPSAVPARMTLIVTTLLAIVVILQSVTEQTVKVPYTTPMQLFLIVNVLFIVIAVMETLLVLYLKNRNHVSCMFCNFTITPTSANGDITQR